MTAWRGLPRNGGGRGIGNGAGYNDGSMRHFFFNKVIYFVRGFDGIN